MHTSSATPKSEPGALAQKELLRIHSYKSRKVHKVFLKHGKWKTQQLRTCINNAIQPTGYKSTTHEHGGEVCLQKLSPHLTFFPEAFLHQLLSFGWDVAIIELYGEDSPWPRNFIMCQIKLYYEQRYNQIYIGYI